MLRRGFHTRRDGVELRLAEAERGVLSDLLGELADWLQPAEPGPTRDPLSQLVGNGTLLKDMMLQEVIDSRVSRLTPSEIAVMNALAKGMRPQQIAEELGKSEKTIRNQITSAKARLGARTRDQALSYALGFGLIDL